MFGHLLPKIPRRGILAAAAMAMALPFVSGDRADARTLEEAKAAGAIIVGIQGDNSPWGFVNSSGVQDGFDADMAKAFAESLGVEVQFVPLAVANRIPALQTQKVDVLFATMAMTEERAQSMQYSIPYAANQLAIVAPKEIGLAAPEQLSGLRIGVPRASAMDNTVTAIAPADADILRFDDDAANIQALLSGQVDVVGANQFYLQRLETARPGVYENTIPLTALYNGVGSRLGEADWNAALNEFLAAFIQTPEYAAIYQKWMQLDPPEFPESVPNVPFTVVTN